MPKSNATEETAVSVAEIQMTEMTVNIVGTSPLVPHAVSAKAKGSLLFPAPRKNMAERATSMKHEPYEEFVDACYRFRDADQQKTRLYMPAGAFHGAMATSAIDMAGAKKSQIGRLTTVVGGKIPIFGVPQIWCTIVRSSDMARTPDVRTLPCLPEWCCTITVQFVASLIKSQSIINLLGAAGVFIGVGDGRPEKGKLGNGKFRLCSNDDPQFLRILKQGTAAQDAALADPTTVDEETDELLSWFKKEKTLRSAAPATTPKPRADKIDAAILANGKSKRASKSAAALD